MKTGQTCIFTEITSFEKAMRSLAAVVDSLKESLVVGEWHYLCELCQLMYYGSATIIEHTCWDRRRNILVVKLRLPS